MFIFYHKFIFISNFVAGGLFTVVLIQIDYCFENARFLGEHVATRLFKIKEKSLADYYRICEKVEKLLDDAETALDIVDTNIMPSD